MKYLGAPIDKKRIKNEDWNPTENKIEEKLGCWQGKILAMGRGGEREIDLDKC